MGTAATRATLLGVFMLALLGSKDRERTALGSAHPSTSVYHGNMTESVLIERVFTKELESGLSPDGSGTHLVNQVKSGSVSLLFLSLERRAQLLLLLCFHQDWTSSTRHAYYQEIIASCAVSQAINSYLLTLEGELTPRGEKLLTLGSVTTTPPGFSPVRGVLPRSERPPENTTLSG